MNRVGFDIGGVICPTRNDIKDVEGGVEPNSDVLKRIRNFREQC